MHGFSLKILPWSALERLYNLQGLVAGCCMYVIALLWFLDTATIYNNRKSYNRHNYVAEFGFNKIVKKYHISKLTYFFALQNAGFNVNIWLCLYYEKSIYPLYRCNHYAAIIQLASIFMLSNIYFFRGAHDCLMCFIIIVQNIYVI